MTILEGKPINGGVGIAAAAVVTSKLGIAGVSPDILQQGVDALKSQLPLQELPEVVVICDEVAVGVATKIPGVKAIGIAAESEECPEDQALDVPVVAGVRDLLKSVTQGQIVIVDGDRGIVEIDPDSKAIASYQQGIERSRSHPVFIESKHLPAKTQAGRTVLVYARASSGAELAQAVEEGADGVVVEPFESEVDYREVALTAALGKPVAFPASFVDKELVRAAMKVGGPGQVQVLFPASHFERLASKMAEAIEASANDPANKEMDRPEVLMGALASSQSAAPEGAPIRFALVDVRNKEASAVGEAVADWLEAAETVVFDVGDLVEILEPVVAAGARGLVTVPGLVAQIKDAIRAFGLEELE